MRPSEIFLIHSYYNYYFLEIFFEFLFLFRSHIETYIDNSARYFFKGRDQRYMHWNHDHSACGFVILTRLTDKLVKTHTLIVYLLL